MHQKMNNTFQMCRPFVDDTYLTSSSNSDLVQDYLSWKRSYTKKAHQAYSLWVRRFQEFVNKPPESLRHTDYVAFAASLRGRHAPCGIQFALAIVHNYLRFFAEQGRLRFPLYLAKVPAGVRQSHEAIEESEYKRIVEILRSKKRASLRDVAMIMLLHDTGVRIGELLSLEIEDLEDDYSAVIRTEKTIRQRRIFWNADTDNVLQQYLVERVNQGPVEIDAVFITQYRRTARPIGRRSVERILKEAAQKAGITKKVCLHSFRHSFIHRLAKLSVPDAIIAQLVGHSTPGTIAHYTKLSRPEFKDYAVRQLQFTGKPT
jgi:integrase/recombinase XerD